MSIRTILLAVVISSFLVSPTSGLEQVVVTDFSSDPLAPRGGAPLFQVRGPGAARFIHEPARAPRFAGDTRGSLAVHYDSLEPTSRCYTSIPGGLTQDDDFVFGALLTIRSAGLAADPFGFHPIGFTLFNSTTTGDDRTGDLSDFSSDTFDTVELSYFPNVSPFFGGPFLSPDVFGQAVAPDAFAAFAFDSIPFELRPDTPYLVELEYSALSRSLTAQVWVVRADGRALAQAASHAEVDLSGLTGFLVDSLGISAYHDGFNLFAQSGRSLLATVDYDLLYAARKEDGRLPPDLNKALRRLRRTSPVRVVQSGPR